MYHYCIIIRPMICLSLSGLCSSRRIFRGSFPYGDVKRVSTYLLSMCVEPLSVSVWGSKSVRIKSRTNCVHTIGLCPASARHWADVGSMLGRVVDGRPALIRHLFSVSCLLGSLHNFALFLTIYYSMLCFLDSVS